MLKGRSADNTASTVGSPSARHRTPKFIAGFVLGVLCMGAASHIPRILAGTAGQATAGPSSGRPTVPAAHVVRLSWNASRPASKAAPDAIVGYIVYRSTTSHDRAAKPVTSEKVISTTYADSAVESGKTYYYVTRAVSASGKLSGPSTELSVRIPH
jgi:hypothetical protein